FDVAHQASTLLVGPVVEVGSASDEDAVEERAGVETHGSREVAAGQGFAEVGHVAADRGWVEGQFLAAEQQVVGLELTFERIERLIECVAGAGGGGGGRGE